jgi:hypothetical protein
MDLRQQSARDYRRQKDLARRLSRWLFALALGQLAAYYLATSKAPLGRDVEEH